MAIEIERKFLVTGEAWRPLAAHSKHIVQGYLSVERVAVRVRIVNHETAFLTVKADADDIARHEFEYAIPLADAKALINVCEGRLIEKVRHIIPADDLKWEVDEFSGAHQGLIIAEIELPATDRGFEMPSWLGREVTGDASFQNSRLAMTGARTRDPQG